jgi:hypothetical protein
MSDTFGRASLKRAIDSPGRFPNLGRPMMTREVSDYKLPKPGRPSRAQFELSVAKLIRMGAQGPSWLIAFIALLCALTIIIIRRG